MQIFYKIKYHLQEKGTKSISKRTLKVLTEMRLERLSDKFEVS